MFTYHGRGIIVVGDKTTHGGEVITGAATLNWHGIPVACIGDKVTCPRCSGTHTIVQGAETATWMGKNIATHGDKVSCGATLISRFNHSPTISDTHASSSDSGNYVEVFQIFCGGVPLTDIPYRIIVEGSPVVSGNSDGSGKTVLSGSESGKKVELYLDQPIPLKIA